MMKTFNKVEVENFFYKNILPSFPEKAHLGLIKSFDKNLFELRIIVKTLNDKKVSNSPLIIDYGCGLGINLIILSCVFECSCTGIDRFDEFDSSHAREVGDTDQVIKRLNDFGVSIIKADPVLFVPNHIEADLVTSFDVIEHFNFPPTLYIKNMLKSLKEDGNIMIGTPNQAHIFNRIKLLFGFNIWEDFDYWMNFNPFYGHVRELLTSELKLVVHRNELDHYDLYQTSYPIYSRLKMRLPKGIAKLLYTIIQIVFKIFPNFNYYNLIVARRK